MGKYQMVPVEDIRSTGITYEQMIMRCIDRLDLVLAECAKEEKFLPIDAKIRLIDGLIYAYHNKEYVEKRTKIEEDLAEIGQWNYEYFKVLMEWVKLISSKFAEMDILPERKIGFIAGVGPAHEHPELFGYKGDDD